MDIFFQDPSVVPLPPDEVRIRGLRAEPYPDGLRVRISIELDPFQKRPNLDLAITGSAGEEVAQVSIIETMLRKLELTMHLRRPPASHPAGDQAVPATYTLTASLFYAAPVSEEDPHLPEKTVVDEARTVFEIPA